MKSSKKILGAILTVVMTLTMLFNVSAVAKASSYTVTISTGEVAEATFDTSAITITGSGTIAGISTREVSPGVTAQHVLTISGLSYGDKIAFDAAKLIKVPATGKYNKINGLKISGADALINPAGNTNITLTVTESEEYVVAYGVDSIIEYGVQYTCNVKGSNSKKINFDEKEALFAEIAQPVVVPSRHYEGYIPTDVTVKVNGTELKKGTDYTVETRQLKVKDENNKDITKDVLVETTIKVLAEKTLVQYDYEPLGATTSYVTEYKTDYYTIYGPTKYSYEYQYVEGEPVIRSTTIPGTTTVTNRRDSNQNAAHMGGDNVGGTANVQGDTGDGTAEGIREADTTTIGENETPLSGGNGKENVEIPEPEPPKKGISLVVRVIITVTIFTLFMILMVIISSFIIRRRNYK